MPSSFKLSLRELLVLIALIGALTGWYRERLALATVRECAKEMARHRAAPQAPDHFPYGWFQGQCYIDGRQVWVSVSDQQWRLTPSDDGDESPQQSDESDAIDPFR